MSDTKTQTTDVRVADFLANVTDPVRRADAETLIGLFESASGEPATMWGPSIIGFGRYRYAYDSGRTGEAARISFSPRKAELVLYLLVGLSHEADLLAKLGKHRTGKSCLYIKRLADIDMTVLGELIDGSLAHMDATYTRY